ncbi:MAG: FGLLP motif-containing membrane protein [Actinomycetota bacterium]|nr:FGLLP motif-containing membrane protein [Actinomycetota bacterium]
MANWRARALPAASLVALSSLTWSTLGLLVGAEPASAATPVLSAGTVLVTNLDRNSVDTINPVSGAVTAVSGAGLNGPLGIVVAPDGRTAYVTNSLGNTVTPINLTTSPFSTESPIPVGSAPSAIAISPSGDLAYVSNFNSNSVTPLLLSHSPAIAEPSIPVGAGPWSIAFSPSGRWVIVSNSEANNVTLINTATRATTTIDVGGRPEAIAVAPSGAVAYVVSGTRVIPINWSVQPAVTEAAITIPNVPVGIAVNPHGTSAFTVNADNTVTRIDLTTQPATVARAVPVGSLSQADGVAISPNGQRAYIADATDTVTPINLDSRPVTAASPIVVGSSSFGVAVIPDQAPRSVFHERVRAVGRVSVFDASGSRAPNGSVALYRWNFGDGTALTTSSPLVRHRYVKSGAFRVSLIEVTADGTSLARTFTGQSVSNNGGASSQAVLVAHVSSPLEIYPANGAPGTAVTIRDTTLTQACHPLNIYFDGRLAAQSLPVGRVLNDPSVVVPGDATIGAHTISVSCSTPAAGFLNVKFLVVALRNHLSEFSVAMPNPGILKKHLASAGLFGLLFLLFGRIFAAGFPSEWMDRTYASNFERMSRRLRRRFPWMFIDHTKERPIGRRLSVGTGLLLVFIAAASLIDSFLSPGFGLNRTSLWLFLGQCVGIGIITLVSEGPIALVGMREKRTVHLHVLVGGLAIAVVCVVASRLLRLAPGYCYGLIAVYVLHPTPHLKDEGRYHFVSSLVVLAVSTAAFFLTIPVYRAATNGHPTLWALILDPALNMTFLAGFSSVAFGMFPLPFLPGHVVARWNRWAWAFLSVVGLMGYVAVLLSPGSGTLQELHSAGMIPLMTAFVLFAVASLGFWVYHLRRAKALGELELDDADNQEDLEVFASE